MVQEDIGELLWVCKQRFDNAWVITLKSREDIVSGCKNRPFRLSESVDKTRCLDELQENAKAPSAASTSARLRCRLNTGPWRTVRIKSPDALPKPSTKRSRSSSAAASIRLRPPSGLSSLHTISAPGSPHSPRGHGAPCRSRACRTEVANTRPFKNSLAIRATATACTLRL